MNNSITLEQQVEHIVTQKLLDNVDGINSGISNSLTILTIAIGFFALVVSFNFFQRKQIVDKVMADVKSDLYQIKKQIEEENNEKTTKHFKQNIKHFTEQLHQEEFYRNMLFKDLYDILAHDIHINSQNNLQEVYMQHGERMVIVIQLTSGIPKETISALRKLSTGSYKTIEQQDSFKAYLRILEKSDDMEIIMELENYKSKRGSLSHSSPS